MLRRRSLPFVEHARVLGHDVAATTPHDLGQLVARTLDLSQRDVAQRTDLRSPLPQDAHRGLAGGATFVVRPVRERVRHAGVAHQQRELRGHRDVAHVERAAVEEQRTTGTSAAG